MPNPWTIQTGSGAQQIELYDPGTFNFEPIRIQTASGPMVPYITDPSDADTGIRIYTNSRGVQGVNSVGILRIDDFEDGDRSGWTVPSSTGSDTIVSPGLHGTDFGWQLDGFREAHLAGADAVDRGPQPGDIFECSFKVDNYSGNGLYRFEFACSGVNDSDLYRIEYELNTSDPDVGLRKISGNSIALESNFVNMDPRPGDVVRSEVYWNVGNSDISIDHYFNGSLQGTTTITDTEYSQPGVCLFMNDNTIATVDEFRILPN